MPKVRITKQYLSDIGNAIREKNWENNTYQPVELAEKIKEINVVSDIDLSGYAELDEDNVFINKNTFTDEITVETTGTLGVNGVILSGTNFKIDLTGSSYVRIPNPNKNKHII